MKWYHMKGPGGTICCKGSFAQEAVLEAAERWGCGTEDITVTGEEDYNRTGERIATGSALAMTGKEKAAADGQDP